MLHFHPELVNIGWSTVRRFYKEELELAFNRCAKPVEPIELNFVALAKMMVFLKEKMEKGYKLYSLDETGFGSTCLQRYS